MRFLGIYPSIYITFYDYLNPLVALVLKLSTLFSLAVGKEDKSSPYLLFLQGGPGFECARPTEAGGWVKKACEEYRVVLLDQALIKRSPSYVVHYVALLMSRKLRKLTNEMAKNLFQIYLQNFT